MIEPGFYLGDCMNYLKDMPDKSIDLAVCDPPYGINVGKSLDGHGGGQGTLVNVGGGRLSAPKSIRRSMTAAHRAPHISRNCGE